MRKEFKHSEFNPPTELFPQFSLSQCFKGCSSSHLPPQMDAGMGCLEVGDAWGYSLLPRLTGAIA